MSIRLRLAVVFTVAAAILFALGSWLFVTALSSSLLGTIDAQLATRLSTASRYLAGNASAQTGNPAPGEYIVQVISPAGRVIRGSADAGTTPALPAAQLARARRQPLTLTVADEDERERIMAAPLPGHSGWVALAAVDLEAFDATVGDATRNLVIAGLVFAGAAGFGSYGLARAALSPVERLRREVAALSERDQAHPDPAAGVQVPRTRDEIAALARTMNQLLDRLHLALARQRALVADASHELRTPLAVLNGELELAGRPGRSREELEGAVARAGEEAARLARIT
jgi:two-component system, OmpR family, sensor kinase